MAVLFCYILLTLSKVLAL